MLGGRVFPLYDKVLSGLSDFKFYPALGLQLRGPRVPLQFGAMDTIDWSRVPAAQWHRLGRGVNLWSVPACEKSTKSSEYCGFYDRDKSEVPQTGQLRVQASRALTRNSMGIAGEIVDRRRRCASTSDKVRSTRRQDEENVTGTDEKKTAMLGWGLWKT